MQSAESLRVVRELASPIFQVGAADLALPVRRRSAPSGGRELHAVSERGGSTSQQKPVQSQNPPA